MPRLWGVTTLRTCIFSFLSIHFRPTIFLNLFVDFIYFRRLFYLLLPASSQLSLLFAYLPLRFIFSFYRYISPLPAFRIRILFSAWRRPPSNYIGDPLFHSSYSCAASTYILYLFSFDAPFSFHVLTFQRLDWPIAIFKLPLVEVVGQRVGRTSVNLVSYL